MTVPPPFHPLTTPSPPFDEVLEELQWFPCLTSSGQILDEWVAMRLGPGHRLYDAMLEFAQSLRRIEGEKTVWDRLGRQGQQLWYAVLRVSRAQNVRSEDEVFSRCDRLELATKAFQKWMTSRFRPVVPPAPSAKPNPEEVASSHSGRVRLFGRADRPAIDGSEVERLNETQYEPVLALLIAGEVGLSKDELAARREGDPRGVLDRLRKKPKWCDVIDFPGVTGGRYRIG